MKLRLELRGLGGGFHNWVFKNSRAVMWKRADLFSGGPAGQR